MTTIDNAIWDKAQSYESKFWTENAINSFHEEEKQRLPPPLVQYLLERLDAAERLRHLLAGQAQEAVVHPDMGELLTCGTRLRQLVLMMRENQIEPTAVDLEGRPEQRGGHRRAFDVPARPPLPPGGVPGGVLAGLVRLPEREIARILLE